MALENSINIDTDSLRNKLLDLAMRGKLVKQDANDEPASELLKKITDEKDRLIKEKKIKRTKKLPEITDDEKSFEIPDSWKWVRLGDLSRLITKGTTPKGGQNAYSSNGIAYYRAESVKNGRILTEKRMYVPKGIHEGYLKRSKLIVNDILVTIAGTLGNVGIVGEKDVPGNINQAIAIVRPVDVTQLNMSYMVYAISAVIKLTVKNKKTTSIPNLTLRQIGFCSVPLPPLAEQNRIADKLDQLFSLLRKIESASDEYSLLKQTLKQKLLDLAVQGKLVKQDPSDEPANVLLEKIYENKAQLIKEKKVKRTKKLPEITDNEKPFRIPDSWKWVRLSDVSNYIQRGRSPKYDKKNHNHPIISQKCIQWESINLDDAKFLTEEFWNKLEDYRFLQKKDILWNSTGTGTVGRVNIVKVNFNKVPVDSHVTLIRLNDNLVKDYVYNYLRSPIIQNNLDKYLTGTTNQKELGLSNILNILVPIPPLAEQKRIVAKLDRLFNIMN